jgi:inner membrane protein
MDSVTQVALGSAVGVAVMGRRVGIWKSALWGGLCGTLPDLDVLIDHGDPIRNMTFHRAESHALSYLTLLSPLLAWLVHRLDRPGASFRRWWLATWLALVTHPLLDWLTIYGTQLGLPFTDHPFAVGSIFVIDPIYTVLLGLGLAAAALAARRRRGAGRGWNLLGLALASGYLGWSIVVQAHVTTLAQASLRNRGLASERLLVVPTPFNTVLWRVLAIDGDSYLEGFHSLLDRGDDIAFTSHQRGLDLFQRYRHDWHVNRIAWFSHGFFRMRRDDGVLQISDLRMGEEPNYTFTFNLPQPACPTAAADMAAADEAAQPCRRTDRGASTAAGKAVAAPADRAASPANAGEDPAAAPVLVPQRIDIGSSINWLWRRMLGDRLPSRGQESGLLVNPAD